MLRAGVGSARGANSTWQRPSGRWVGFPNLCRSADEAKSRVEAVIVVPKRRSSSASVNGKKRALERLYVKVELTWRKGLLEVLLKMLSNDEGFRKSNAKLATVVWYEGLHVPYNTFA